MEGGGNHRQTIGRQGENIACRFLESRGHTILERNWRSGHLEIDIISFDSKGIHFIEVKTRKMHIQAPPQDNVNALKQQRTAKAALAYLKTKKGLPYGNYECLFDVIAVTFGPNEAKTDWFPQAYIPIYL
jgi:putative endonuclease